MNENKKGAVLRGLRGFTHLIEEMGAYRSKQKARETVRTLRSVAGVKGCRERSEKTSALPPSA
ncbi:MULTISPECIES: hypothetical protein [unclassified Caballeronia]|uniref:hypothetical protein n=1 Tax=unclassified Caballeronia TaxID=2646786 RepID=UPI002029B173|nr:MULTISPECIES: hypothetical protein [unclassified Caballeronia]